MSDNTHGQDRFVLASRLEKHESRSTRAPELASEAAGRCTALGEEGKGDRGSQVGVRGLGR